jgi:hypothetical protein
MFPPGGLRRGKKDNKRILLDLINMRKKIPLNIEDQVIFKSDKTCCVCHDKNKKWIINHIDGNNENYIEDNLCILCLDCHAEFHSTSNISRKTTPGALKLFKKSWENIVKKRRKVEANIIPVIQKPSIKNPNWIIGPDEGKYDFSTGTLRHIPDPATLDALGYKRNQFVRWSKEKFNSVSQGHDIRSVRKCRLVQKGNTSGVYAILEGIKRWVPDKETLLAIGRNFDEVESIDEKEFFALQEGESLVKSSEWFK